MNKYVSGNVEDGYRLTLEAFASNQLTTTTTTTALDIVLVLDVSGSMKELLTDSKTVYTPTYEISKENSYYVETRSDRYRSVKYTEAYSTEEWVWDSFLQGHWETVEHPAGWIYGSESDPTYVEPMTSAEDTEHGHVQFYTAITQQRVTKMDALKTATKNFISKVNESNTDPENRHRISIVKFADDSYHNNSYDSIGNNKNWDGYNYTQVVEDFTDDAEELTAAIDSLSHGGATAADYGLDLAARVLNGDGALSGAREDSKKIVVFFTDGEPNHDNGFSGRVAAAAVETAYELKKDGVTIYTVGTFEDADDDITNYMNGVSSNYPSARAEDGWRNYSSGAKNTDGVEYYALATDAESLDSVFDDIADQVTTGTLTANPDATAVLSDTLSEYFNFPGGFDGTSADVRFAKASAYSEEQGFTFADPEPLPDEVEVTVTVTYETIQITGFNYKENAAS